TEAYIAIAIGLDGQRSRYELLARHRLHGGDQIRIGDIGSANLPVHHVAARRGGIEHAQSPRLRGRVVRYAPAKRKQPLFVQARSPVPIEDLVECRQLRRLGRHCLTNEVRLPMPARPRGGVVTQRSAKPFTPVQFRAWPPSILPPFCATLGFKLWV